MNDKQRVTEFLNAQTHMVVTVVLPNGQPWAVPVRMQERDGRTFAWDSHMQTEHSKAIADKPEVNLLCYDNAMDNQVGVYMQAYVTNVVPKEHGMARYYAEVSRVWLNDETYVKREVEL